MIKVSKSSRGAGYKLCTFVTSLFILTQSNLAETQNTDKQKPVYLAEAPVYLAASSSLNIRSSKPKSSGLSLDSFDDGDDSMLEENIDPRRKKRLDRKKWYLKSSLMLNYFTLGAGINKLLDQVEGSFAGDTLNPQLLVVQPSFKIKTKETIERAPTNIVPTGNLGFGYIMKEHQFEVDFGVAGLVPLNTINISKTDMTLTESNICSGSNANASPGSCPMADLGFVNPNTAKGKYNFAINMNEDVWLFTPSVYYDYIFMNEKWGRLSAGASVGAMILSIRQQVKFKGTRKSGDIEATGDDSDAYQDRVIEGSAISTAMHDIGPIFRVYMGFRRAMTKGVLSEVRIGFNYGFVDLDRDMDGSGSATVGNLKASFPLTSLGFENQEVNRFELLGGFIHMGIVF